MDKGHKTIQTTVTVTGSQALGRPDGRIAIRLETRELGSIAFEVNAHAIAMLRRELAVAEQMLETKGKA